MSLLISFLSFLSLISTQEVDLENKPLFEIENDTITFYNDDLSIKHLRVIKNPQQIPFDKYKFQFLNNTLYFFGGLSGDVYTINNDSLKRLDATPDHRLNISSNIYVHNDTLFKYGGYGYWSQRNFNIYFDFESKEWQVYKASKESYNPMGSFYGLHFKSEERIYFFGGKIIDETNRVNQIKNEAVIYFDFKTKTFEKLGTSELELYASHYLVHDNEFIYLIKDNILYQISPKDNTVNLYSYPNRLWRISKERHFNTYNNGQYYIEVNDALNNKSRLISLSKEELIKKPLGSTNLYRKELFTKTVLIVLVVFLAAVLSLILIKIFLSKKQILLKEESLVYKNIHYPLEKVEIKILKKLVATHKIYTKEVLEIIENKDLSYVHNTRIKDKTIKDLNIKLKMIFNFPKPPIVEIRSSEDRRIKLFHFDKTVKGKMSKIKII